MKKLSVFTAVIIVCVSAVFFNACIARKSEPITGKYFIPADSSIKKGEMHFMHHCQKCHPSGEAGLGPSIVGNPAPMFLKRFQVRHGLGVMPSFKKDELSANDLRNISAYLRAWKSYMK